MKGWLISRVMALKSFKDWVCARRFCAASSFWIMFGAESELLAAKDNANRWTGDVDCRSFHQRAYYVKSSFR